MDRSLVRPANRHPILDREWGKGVVEDHFSEPLDALEEVVTYGADMIRRIGRASVSDVMDASLVMCLFRQALASVDAGTVCLRQCAVHGAFAHARSFFETHLAIRWILKGDRKRLLQQWYVGSLRYELKWAERMLPHTKAGEEYRSDWEDESLKFPERIEETKERAEIQREEVLRILGREPYKSINEEFERSGRKFPYWYQVGPESVNSYYQMAARLGMTTEYTIFYIYAFTFVHAGTLHVHARGGEGGGISVVPIRYPEQFALVFRQFTPRIVLLYREMLELYRPGEVKNLVSRYTKDWRKRLSVPDVEVQVNESDGFAV